MFRHYIRFVCVLGQLFFKDILMLVLAAKKGERIFVGKDIIITIVKTSTNVTRIGIEAPREINVIREEVVKRENQK